MHHVLYHANCYDGFGSAFSAWKAFGDEATYHPVVHGNPPPLHLSGDTLYILDFSYNIEALKLFLMSFKKVVVLDHHKTALELLGPSIGQIDGIEIIFDMNKSGALLSWEYFHPEEDTPKLIQHISDRDLWKFEVEGSDLVHKALLSHPMEFEVWDKLDVDSLIKEGVVCARMHNKLVDTICNNSYMGKVAGYDVPIVNTSIAWSEVGAELVKRHPEAKFVASYTVLENKTVYSLRCKDDFDVSAVAKKFGGGGHKQAAGFSVDKASSLNNISFKGQNNIKCPKCGSYEVMTQRTPDGSSTCMDCRYEDRTSKFEREGQ